MIYTPTGYIDPPLVDRPLAASALSERLSDVKVMLFFADCIYFNSLYAVSVIVINKYYEEILIYCAPKITMDVHTTSVHRNLLSIHP